GARGQPAAERLKQSAPNYLDLRDFAQSNIADPIDDDLAHIARKGPKAKATGAKSPKTRAKAPKSFSDREMAQFQQAASGYTASAAPAGSTIFPQEVLSSGKKRKKRPWLMQLIVISTALCLLALLVVGLVYNFGDLLNRGGDEPDPNGIAKLPPEIDGPPGSQQGEPVVEGATLLVGKPGVVVLREKHKYMNWVKFDVGSSDPITVNLTEPQQDEYGDFLEELVEGATLQVSLARDEDGLFVLETLEPPPAVQPGGESLETNLSGEEAVVLDGSTVTFNLPGQGKLSYAIPTDREELREQVESLVVHLRENPSAVAPVHLRMEGEGSERRIVAIDAIKIPEQSSVDPVTPVLPNPNKRPSVLELGNPQDFEILAGQNRVKIRIDDLGTTKYYHYAAEEEQKILNLVKFLKEGGKGLKLKIEQDDDRITRLFYNDVLPGVPIPNIPVGPDPAGPMGRSPVAIYVLWLPSAQLSSKPVRWQLNLPSSGSIRYEDGQFSSSLDALLRAFDGIESARVWQANFSGPRSFYQLAENEDAFEPFGIEVDKDRVDPESRASFSLKTAGSSRSLYSLEFDVKRGDYVDVDLTADLAKNAANRGFALRIPRGSDECVDLYFISNKHLSAEHGYPPVSREKQLSLTGPTLRFLPSWPAGPRFTVLTQGKQGMYKLLLAPALGSGGTPRPDLLFSPSMPDPNAFVTGAIQGFPKALVIPKREEALACSIVMNFEYFNTYEDHFRAQINSYEADMNQKKAVLPDLEVYENLISFGQAVGKSKFVPGDDTYGEYLLKLTTSFAKEVLALDDPKTNALRAKLVKLSDPKRFHLSQSTLSQFWRTARDAMKKEAELPLSGFGYPAERAERDVQTAFHIVNFFLHA
ncbi:MAG: hypothetical protein VB997_05900, partial [Opitutales bacterium]